MKTRPAFAFSTPANPIARPPRSSSNLSRPVASGVSSFTNSNRLSKATTIAASVDWLGADLKVLTSSSVDLIIAFHLTKPKRRRLCRRDHVGRLGAERFGWARRPAAPRSYLQDQLR